MRLDDDFELVHGARYWHALVHEASLQGSEFPPIPPEVTVALLLYGHFCGGVGAINTDASMVMFEWFTLSKALSSLMRRRAAEHLMRAGLVYATAIGKRPVIINGTRGIRQMAQRIGLASGTSFEVLMGEMP